MDDTIYRQAAIEAFKKELTVGESKGKYVTICSAISYEGAKQILESLPSAQPRPRGKWIPKDDGRYYCSSCNDRSPKGYRWDYCPNCGADMR